MRHISEDKPLLQKLCYQRYEEIMTWQMMTNKAYYGMLPLWSTHPYKNVDKFRSEMTHNNGRNIFLSDIIKANQ